MKWAGAFNFWLSIISMWQTRTHTLFDWQRLATRHRMLLLLLRIIVCLCCWWNIWCHSKSIIWKRAFNTPFVFASTTTRQEKEQQFQNDTFGLIWFNLCMLIGAQPTCPYNVPLLQMANATSCGSLNGSRNDMLEMLSMHSNAVQRKTIDWIWRSACGNRCKLKGQNGGILILNHKVFGSSEASNVHSHFEECVCADYCFTRTLGTAIKQHNSSDLHTAVCQVSERIAKHRKNTALISLMVEMKAIYL